MINILKLYDKIKEKVGNRQYVWWIGHCLLCFIITLWRWDYAIIVGLTIEGTQIESGIWQKWDHLFDLIADSIGIVIALILREVL